MQINYDFPWYIQNSPKFMTLYEGLFNIAKNVSSLPFINMLDLDNTEVYPELLAAGEYFGLHNAWVATQDALVYNFREWGPRAPETEYYWNGRATPNVFKAMANYIRAKVQIRGEPLSLATLKKFYEVALDGYNYSIEDNIVVTESLQHFEITIMVTEEVAQALIEMSSTDRWPFGKPVGISYNVTYVLTQGV